MAVNRVNSPSWAAIDKAKMARQNESATLDSIEKTQSNSSSAYKVNFSESALIQARQTYSQEQQQASASYGQNLQQAQLTYEQETSAAESKYSQNKAVASATYNQEKQMAAAKYRNAQSSSLQAKA
ncbi:MAG: hypothetical protein HQK79_04930 [Desulfobacterales bacterium]|nr:hypothetical protein [Desulfobacterales bacterium]